MKYSLTVLLYSFLLIPWCAQAHGSLLLGVSGHLDRKGIYNSIPLDTQIENLKSMGLSIYRSGCRLSECAELAKTLEKSGVTFLLIYDHYPVLQKTPDQNYWYGFDMAKTTMEAVRGRVEYVEAGNELDSWSWRRGDGSGRNDFDPVRYEKAKAFIRGLIAGTKSVSPNTQVLVDDAGWCHYGFLDALWSDGVRWDITAFHWYASHGFVRKAGCSGRDVIRAHQKFERPIWITEFNDDRSAKLHCAVSQAAWMRDFLSDIKTDAQSPISAAIIYELYDEAGKLHGEDFYGLLSADGSPKAFAQFLRDRRPIPAIGC